jgi:ureidoglycolate lyase
MRRIVEVKAPLAVRASEIDKQAFAPFGDVIRASVTERRTDWSEPFENNRSDAHINCYTTGVDAVALPTTLKVMERHVHSFQTFLPLDADRYLVCVAPHGHGDLPDMSGLRAFIVRAGTGITYRANVWHHPMTALTRRAQFAVWKWRSGGADDEEFVELSRPVRIEECSDAVP